MSEKAPDHTLPVDTVMSEKITPIDTTKRLLEEQEQPPAKHAKTEEAESKELETSNELMRLILQTRVDAFQMDEYRNVPIYVCNRTDLIVDVWKGMVKHNFSSVPITNKSDIHVTYSFIDMIDIVRYVVQHFGQNRLDEAGSFWVLVEEEKEFMKKTVNDVLHRPHADRHIYMPVYKGYSMMSVLEPLARERGLHRVPVLDQQRRILHLITQSQLAKFLDDNLDILGPKRFKKISSVPHFFKQVLSVKEDTMVVDAFHKIAENGVTGLAVVNEHGRLRANISTRDLKLISYDARMFWRLGSTVKNFLIKLRKEYQAKHNRPRTIVTAKPTDTIESIIRKLHELQVHRVYIVDENKMPIGEVSIRDLLLEILNESDSAVKVFVQKAREATSSRGAVEAGEEEFQEVV
jgi:CBS domain-containing protein